MARETDLYRDVLDSLSEGVYLVDLQGRITFWNRAAERITGYAAETVLGRACSDGLLCHQDDRGIILCGNGCPLRATMGDGVEREARVYVRHARGHRVPVAVRSSPLRNAAGDITGAVESFRDDTEGLAALSRVKELEVLAYVDPLTGLGNRRFAEITISARLQELTRFGWPFGLLFVDLDRFKDLNDRFGHDAGDDVLRAVSATLERSLRPFDFAGRWGGEEFVAVVANVDLPALSRVAERFRALVAASPLRHDEEEVRVTVSVGAATAREDDSVASLVERADALMYRSKAAGRDRVTAG